MPLDRLAARLKRGRMPSLFLVTDAARGGNVEAAVRRLPRGAAVVFRHYEARDREAQARALRALTRRQGARLIVAGDPRLAARVGADGFHAPEGLAQRIALARRLIPCGLMTVAAHGESGLVRAAELHADAVLLSPVFPTRSHVASRPLGVVRFAAMASRSRVPVIALGGVDARNAQRLAGTRVAGFAAIGALMR